MGTIGQPGCVLYEAKGLLVRFVLGLAVGLCLMAASPRHAMAYGYAEADDGAVETPARARFGRQGLASPSSHNLHGYARARPRPVASRYPAVYPNRRRSLYPRRNRYIRPYRAPVETAAPPAAVKTSGQTTPPPSPAPTAPAPEEDIETIENNEVTVAADAEGPETWWTEAWPVWDRVVDAHTPRTTRRHKFGTLISHRNNGGFGQDPFHSLLGFDQGLLKVGLGLRFGIFDMLDIGMLRMNATLEVFNTYEFDLKLQILNQAKFGIDLGMRAGLSWFEQRHAKQAAGFFAQILLGRLLFNRVYAGGGLLFHTSSSGPKKTRSDSNETFALQVYADGRITKGFSFAMELTRALAGYSLVNPAFTMSPRFITNRHTFSIILSNTQYTTADGIITGSDRTRFSKWMLGFNITRELG